MLFQAVLIHLMNLIILLSLFSGYLLVIIGGTMNLKRKEKVEKSILFIIIGAAGIIYEVIRRQIYNLVDEIIGLGFEEYYTIIFIIPNIISIITFGVLIIVLGKLNSENSGKYLLISGILWTIYAVILLIINLGSLFPFPGPPPSIYLAISILGLIILAFMIGARILFVIYTAKIDNVVFLVSSIALLISSTTYVIFSLLLTFMP